MTTEELFAQMEAQAATEKEYCVIDPITREISVPEVYQKIGVVSDEKTNRIYFQCPRIVGDNVDLTKYGIRVNYQNANGQTKPYPVDDVAVSGDNITFSWLLERPVTTYKGTINFVVCAIKTSGDEITNEWNTTLAKAEVLEGLEPDISITEDEESIVELLVAQCTQKLTEMNMAIQNSENATNDAKTATQEAVNATEDARAVIEQITKDSYLHTALETFINEVTAKPTAYGNALVEKIEGYIRQTATKGNQLFDSSSLTAYNEATFSVLNGGKDVKVTGRKTSESAKSSVIYQIKSALFELMKGKTLYVYVNHDAENGWFEFGMQSESTGWTYKQVTNKQWTEVNVPSDLKNTSIALIPNAKTEENITATFKDIKIGLSQFEEWEPYTGGEPAPSPDYPQTIHGVGYMGFFDGEYQYVYHDNDNTLNNNPEWVSSVNIVPCKTGDNVEIVYAKANNKSMYGIIYYKGDKFVSALAAQTGNGKFTVPSGVDGFQWQVYEGGNKPDPSKVIVTINGMYAICVKTVGKNLLDPNKQIIGKHYDTDGNLSANTYRTSTSLIVPTKNKIYVDSARKDMSYILIQYDIYGNMIDRKASLPMGTINEINSNCSKFGVSFYYSDKSVGDINDCIICYSGSKTDFIPYQDSTTYIPISSPLFAGDQLIKRNMEHNIPRNRGYAIFDGSEDETWKYSSTWNQISIQDKKYNVKNVSQQKGIVLCDKFLSGSVSERNSGVKNIVYQGSGSVGFIGIASDLFTDLETAKSWLQSNPIAISYILETPIEEELTPEAQKVIHSITACDEQTTIEIVGVPTDAEVQNQFLLPRNVDGALNTTAYATSKRNEIVLSEQQTATEARLQAIEAQILKEV